MGKVNQGSRQLLYCFIDFILYRDVLNMFLVLQPMHHIVNNYKDFISALDVAIELAQTLSKFPQRCMNADRSSAYYSTYDAKSIDDALQREFSQGIKVITEESIPGSNLHSNCFIFPQNCLIRRIGFELCF